MRERHSLEIKRKRDSFLSWRTLKLTRLRFSPTVLLPQGGLAVTVFFLITGFCLYLGGAVHTVLDPSFESTPGFKLCY